MNDDIFSIPLNCDMYCDENSLYVLIASFRFIIHIVKTCDIYCITED